MTAMLAKDDAEGQSMADALKSWVMVVLTLVFVVLYGAALTGWLKPLPDEKMVTRLEPIIFVIIGYYFGRLPGQQNEKTLKDEIGRQTQKADAAQHSKEQAQQSREALEEKLKNARVALAPALLLQGTGAREAAESSDRPGAHERHDAVRATVGVAINILNS